MSIGDRIVYYEPHGTGCKGITYRLSLIKQIAGGAAGNPGLTGEEKNAKGCVRFADEIIAVLDAEQGEGDG